MRYPIFLRQVCLVLIIMFGMWFVAPTSAQAIPKPRGDAYALDSYAAFEYEAGRVDEAIASLNEALRLDPRNDQVYKSLCLYTLETGRYQQAVSSCQRLSNLRPNYALYHEYWARALEGVSNNNAASQQWRIAANLHAENGVSDLEREAQARAVALQ